MQIQMSKTKQQENNQFALFNIGFRPFFLGAGVFAIVSIVWWMSIYSANNVVTMTNISLSQWHAHEMLYGYGMAVVAGFLLTAVKNWTGIQTLNGRPLWGLFGLWCVARVLFLFGTAFLPWVATADLLFGLLLVFAIAKPIIQAKQWLQLAVVSKVVLLWVGNLVFYLGCYDLLASGMLYAINGAVLLFISLILMMGRRVIPFFIERGVKSGKATQVRLKQYKWLDVSIVVIFLALFINAIFIQVAYLTAFLAFALFAFNGYRLINWHTKGIWHVPLLWSLYLSAWLINVGFLSFAIQDYLIAAYNTKNNMSILTLHIFTIGGIGLMTLSMMSRVALGHTGRNIQAPSRWLTLAFIGLLLSVMFRSFIPMLSSQHYSYWVLTASAFWILGFAIFVTIYASILLKPRIDGGAG